MRWSGTLQQNEATGDIMTSSSDFFASLNLTDTHGITWLGNYGTRLCIAPSSPHAKIPSHSGQFCRGCNFKQSCFKCGAVHPASQYSTNRAHSNPNNAAPSITSGSDSQGRTWVAEPRANTGKARPSRLLS